MGGQQRLDPTTEGGIVLTGAVQVGRSVGRVGPFKGFGEEGHQSGVGVGHGLTSGLGFPLPMPRLARECATASENFLGLPAGERVGKPGLGKRPVPVGGPTGQAQRIGRLTQRHPCEEPQLDEFGSHGELFRQSFEGAVEFEEIVIGGVGRTGESAEIDPVSPAAPLPPVAVPGVVDQHPPHRLGRGGEEVPSTAELLVADQPQVSLVHQSGGVEGVPGASAAIRAAASLRNSS